MVYINIREKDRDMYRIYTSLITYKKVKLNNAIYFRKFSDKQN